MARHLRFIARTVFVDNTPGKNNAIESATQELEYKLNKEGILKNMKRNRYCEKPWMQRRRLAHEECKRVYNSEMGRKMAFLMKTNREDPWRT